MRLEIKILKQCPSLKENNYKEAALNILKASPCPISLSLLSAWTGISKSRLCKVLKQLCKYHPEKIKKITIARDVFYQYVSSSRSTFFAIVKVRKK
jgi:DNA-binding transcriptional regulator GbsR (MarR family)